MEFQIGDRLEIEIANGDYQGKYCTEIIKVIDREMVMAATIHRETEVVALKPRELINVKLFRNDGVYLFQTQVIYRGFAFFTIKLPLGAAQRIQRRADVRVEVRIPVEILYFYRDGVPISALTVQAMDLSAGGIKIRTPEAYPAQTEFKIALALDDQEEVQLKAVVVRTGQADYSQTNPYRFWTAFQFLEIPEVKMRKIRKFIYKQQELRVKSLI